MSIFLFQVKSLYKGDHGIILAPGVPRRLLSQPEVGSIVQGAPIELRRPNGTRRKSIIANYSIRVPEDAVPSDLDDLPILLALPDGVTHEDVPIGTEVWLLSEEHGEYKDRRMGKKKGGA